MPTDEGLVGELSEGLQVELFHPDTDRKPGDTNVRRWSRPTPDRLDHDRTPVRGRPVVDVLYGVSGSVPEHEIMESAEFAAWFERLETGEDSATGSDALDD
jgi:hypothetical protein